MPLKVYSRGISQFRTHRGEPLIRFWKLNPDQAADLKYLSVGQVRLPAGASQDLLVFVGGGVETAGCLGITAFDYSQTDFPLNHCRFFNFTEIPMVGVFGEDRFSLPARDDVVFPFDVSQASMAASIKLAYESEGDWALGYSSVWRLYWDGE